MHNVVAFFDSVPVISLHNLLQKSYRKALIAINMTMFDGVFNVSYIMPSKWLIKLEQVINNIVPTNYQRKTVKMSSLCEI